MKIKTKEQLIARLKEIEEILETDERYPESDAAIIELLDEASYYDVDELKEDAACGLHEADAAYPMHPQIAALLIDIYMDGVENEDPDSMTNLGSLYYTGRAGEQDYGKAAYYYHLADLAGERQATENLGYIYYYGRTGEVDYEKAFQYFLKGALDGHLRSLYKVGDFYKNGYYVEKDPKEAFRIYERCLETMTEAALPAVGADVYMRMGDCYHKGIGVEKDLLKAQELMGIAENLFYKRLMEGDFYQKRNLQHVLDTEAEIRQEIAEELLPDLSWSGYAE